MFEIYDAADCGDELPFFTLASGPLGDPQGGWEEEILEVGLISQPVPDLRAFRISLAASIVSTPGTCWFDTVRFESLGPIEVPTFGKVGAVSLCGLLVGLGLLLLRKP